MGRSSRPTGSEAFSDAGVQMAGELLRVSGLLRRFGDHEVLHGVTFDVRPGQAVAVVGPNGSGKSTLLQCVLGSQQPDGGTITLHGQPLRESDPIARAEIAGVDDSIDFFPDLCVAEHLGLLAAAHDVPDAEAVVEALMAEVGLTEQRTQLPGTLSSGQRRRLALASGFVRPRSLLVLDEPEQRLDGQGVDWLIGRLLDEKAAGGAVLFASHHPGLIDAVADARCEPGAETR
jgi:ABC-2 type transport system ATP-binding protein